RAVGILLHGVISLAVAAAGWVGVSSPGDYAAVQFPPLPRHDQVPGLGDGHECLQKVGLEKIVLLRLHGLSRSISLNDTLRTMRCIEEYRHATLT
ncbi:hypothetical protein, partial [Paracoccus yeei]|uniref:hypothetical protein n=1 Tax=Paracoccus yeei TaxID=147645 RepID=UPI0035AECC50